MFLYTQDLNVYANNIHNKSNNITAKIVQPQISTSKIQSLM